MGGSEDLIKEFEDTQDSAKEAGKSKSSSPSPPPKPKYKPGPKSRKKAMNPWLDIDRQSPGSSSLETKRKSMVDLTDSEDEDHVTSSKPGPVKTFDDLFGGGASSASNGDKKKDSVVFNKDSDDESDEGVKANVEELIRASDDDDGEAIGIDW